MGDLEHTRSSIAFAPSPAICRIRRRGGLHRRDAAGDRSFPECDGNLGNSWSLFAEDRAGTVWIAWQAYEDGGDQVYARHSTASGWSQTMRLTDQKTDVFHTAVAEDSTGRLMLDNASRILEYPHIAIAQLAGVPAN